jgi:GNAT superfamily N-acetyltransferase
VPVVTTYLEMTDRAALRPAPKPDGVVLQEVSDPAVNRWFYETIGADWQWVDRLGWPPERWSAHVARTRTLVATVDGRGAGYVELHPQPGGDVEISMLGLRGEFHGRGIGGWLLTEGIQAAWGIPDARRVWVHTCTLDGPHALANYEARGLRLYRREST